MGRLADLGPAPLLAPGATHLVMDLRPLQEPERSPLTAAYLGHLLEAFALDPLPGEDIVAMLRARRPDPTHDLAERGLVVAGRRWLPPTARVLRSTGLTIDSVLLRGAQVRTGSGGLADGVVGTVYHTAGGAIPVASPLPVVATLLDLAPWELPHRYARTAAARLGHRMRARALRERRAWWCARERPRRPPSGSWSCRRSRCRWCPWPPMMPSTRAPRTRRRWPVSGMPTTARALPRRRRTLRRALRPAHRAGRGRLAARHAGADGR